MKRKPIQIAMAMCPYDDGSTNFKYMVLCDDGTLWEDNWSNGRNIWRKIPDIPQPEDE